MGHWQEVIRIARNPAEFFATSPASNRPLRAVRFLVFNAITGALVASILLSIGVGRDHFPAYSALNPILANVTLWVAFPSLSLVVFSLLALLVHLNVRELARGKGLRATFGVVTHAGGMASLLFWAMVFSPHASLLLTGVGLLIATAGLSVVHDIGKVRALATVLLGGFLFGITITFVRTAVLFFFY